MLIAEFQLFKKKVNKIYWENLITFKNNKNNIILIARFQFFSNKKFRINFSKFAILHNFFKTIQLLLKMLSKFFTVIQIYKK